MTLLYIGLTTLLRLLFVNFFQLVGDEAYYWLWSQHLDWNYYSKGPGIAVTIKLGTLLFGDTPFGVRFFSVLLAAGTGWGVFSLSRRLFSARVGFWSVVMTSVVPIFVVGSLLMTIDPLSIFFWIWTVYVFWSNKDDPTPGRWMLIGLLIGLGMLCKYTNVALIFSFILFFIWHKPHRTKLGRPGFWLMVLVALLCLAPVLIWNWQHDWITFTHLKERGSMDTAWGIHPGEFLGYLGEQAGVFSPFVFLGILISLFRKDIRQPNPQAYRFLASIILPLWIFYTILGINDSGQPNWTAPAVICGIILMVATWLHMAHKQRAIRYLCRAVTVLLAIVAIVLHVLLVYRLPTEKDFLSRLRGARSLALQVEEFQKEYDAPLIIGSHYQVSALIAFYHPGHVQTYVPLGQKVSSQFYFWEHYRQPKNMGQNALYIVHDAPRYPPVLDQHFERVRLVEEIYSYHGPYKEKKYYIYLCEALRIE